MDTRRAGLLLILLCGSSLVVWNLRTIDSSVGQESPELMSESKDGFDKLAPGQSMAYESMSSAMKKMLEPLTDVVVLRTWAAPNWLHVVSGSGKDRATRELRTRKLRECPLTLLMQWVLDEGCVEHHSMVIDIGMNLGWFTALAAANGLQVVAFEPSPARIQYMAKTLELNGWTSVQLRQGALTNEVGQLFVDEARWWEKRSASREGGHGKTQAEALRLDDVVPANTKVCLLKADCHGCEAEAFRSGKQLLEGGAVQVVQMEYDHSVASRASLEILQGMSPHPWQCILLPMGISCSGSDLADKDGDAFQELWDFVAGNVHEDCSASTLEELSPSSAKGYHTDVWLVHADTMDRLRAQPNFVAAQRRLADAQGQQCEFAEQHVEPGVCELMCQRFQDMDEAKKVCSARPTCTKVLPLEDGFELRGGAATPGSTQVNVAEQRRRQAALAEYARKVKLGKIIRTYDTNNSGKLERDQVVKLLTDMDSSTPPGTLPSDEQVDFLLKLYDKAGDQAIVIDELEELLICWHTYTENRALFEDKLNKYDVSKTGKLSKEELKAYLTDLNGGIEVQDSEVDWVMQEGDILGDGQLNKMELLRVTALWFSYVDSKKSNDCCTLL